MRTTARRFGSVLAAATFAAITLVGGLAAAPAGAATQPVSGKAAVTVGDNYFKAEDVTVTAGTKVTWTNKGKILHTVTPDKGKTFGTRALSPKKKYSYTFKKPGEYAYHCSLHGAPGSGQHGTITVVPATTTTSGA